MTCSRAWRRLLIAGWGRQQLRKESEELGSGRTNAFDWLSLSSVQGALEVYGFIAVPKGQAAPKKWKGLAQQDPCFGNRTLHIREWKAGSPASPASLVVCIVRARFYSGRTFAAYVFTHEPCAERLRGALFEHHRANACTRTEDHPPDLCSGARTQRCCWPLAWPRASLQPTSGRRFHRTFGRAPGLQLWPAAGGRWCGPGGGS